MSSRRVLQEIPITTKLIQQDSPEDEVTMSLIHNKQPSSPSRQRHKVNNEYKENMAPVGPAITKDSRTGVLTDTCHPDSGDLSWTNPEDDNIGCLNLESPQLDSNKNEEKKNFQADWNFCTPSKNMEDSDLLGEASHTPIDFSTVTVDDLGISTDSFTNCAGKTPKSLLKHRRRSTIGVRGSPEMNFLIRQIALQRSKRKEEPEPPTNSFSSPRNFLLKDKISAFREAFQILEEDEGKVQSSASSKEEGSQSKNANGREEDIKAPEKKNRECITLDPVSEPDKIYAPTLTSQSKTSEKVPVTCPEKIKASRMLPEVSLTTEVHGVPQSHNEETSTRKKVMFENLLRPALSSQTHSECQSLKKEPSATQASPLLRPVLKKTPKRETVHFEGFRLYSFGEQDYDLSNEESSNSDSFKRPDAAESVKRKRVTFGRELSPEVFDKTLPPNTPLRRGGTPYNHRSADRPTPAPAETYTDSPVQSMPQPDFDFTVGETLQPLSLSLCFEAECNDSDSPTFPQEYMYRISSSEREGDINMSSSSAELTISPTLAVSSSDDRSGNPLDSGDMNEAILLTPETKAPPAKTRVTRCPGKRKFCSSEKSTGDIDEQTVGTNKRLTKTRAKTKSHQKDKKPVTVGAKKTQTRVARGKGKNVKGKFKKPVQKCLYGQREIASRKPLLSPIVEMPETLPTPPNSVGRIFTFVKQPELRDTIKNVKKMPATKGRVRRIRGKDKDISDYFTLQTPASDSALSEHKMEKTDLLEVCLDGEAQIANNEQDCHESENKIAHNDICTKSSDHLQAAEADLDSSLQSISQGSQFTAEKEISEEEQLDLPNSIQGAIFTAVNDMTITVCDTVSLCKTKRRSSTHKCVAQPILKDEYSASLEPVTQELQTQENTVELCPTRNSSLPTEYKEDLIEDIINSPALNETILSLTTVTYPTHKSRRSSRNVRRSTIYCPSENSPKQVQSSESPRAGNVAADSLDVSYSLDDALHISPSKRKVRRSMRLRRDSGITGLTWIQDEKMRQGTGRRRSMNIPVGDQARSPNKGLESIVYSPAKANLKAQSSGINKSRRRTLSTSTFQQANIVHDTKRRRSSSYKDYTNFESNSEPIPVACTTAQDI
ncbi:cell division cycle-associated protein 2 [Discoglossus pictus]